VFAVHINITQLLLLLQSNQHFSHKRWLACAIVLLLALSCGLSTRVAFAQTNVGIGTTTPAASAVLDLTTTTQGLLIPRMTTLQRNPGIVGPATGLLVYDLTLNTFYYFNGTIWLPFVSSAGASAGWVTLGNTGTSPPTNFLGTTDANDLVLKRIQLKACD
jgi:hypothetical protein